MKRIYLLLVLCYCSILCFPQGHKSDLQLVSENILTQLNVKPDDEVILVHSEEKEELSKAIISELQFQHISFKKFELKSNQDTLNEISTLIKEIHNKRYYIFLIAPKDASFLFENIGRPDTGIKIPSKQLFCDWLMPEKQFVRINCIDLNENKDYQQKLLSSLNTTDTIYITSESGTQISFQARNWIIDNGEIYCTPYEEKTNGVIIIDGCAYWGPPRSPIMMNIENGRVTNIDSLSETDKQEALIKEDLTADNNASILCEIGIGTNINALWDSDLMEAEQARGTCHFGFGMNINYGGKIESKKHFDLVILNPTIRINKTLLYENGKFHSGLVIDKQE